MEGSLRTGRRSAVAVSLGMARARSPEGVFDLEISCVGIDGRARPRAGVRPAPRPCVRRGLPSAWFLQARQCLLRRRAGEGSEAQGRGLRSSVEVLKDLLDHGRIFNARDHLDRTAAVLAGLDIDIDQIAGSDLEQPQAGPQGGGQDARSNTRFNRWAHVIETWGAGAGSSGLSAPRRPRLAGVTCSLNRWFGAKTPW